MNSNRQARINRLKAAFQKVEQLMKEGYVVQWDGEVVDRLYWANGLDLGHGIGLYSGIYSEDGEFQDMADLTIPEINKELSERLTVWKKFDVKL